MVRRAEGEIGELMASIGKMNHKYPLGTMLEFKEPSVLWALTL